jgi:tetratricopeptide (TPR) repeat protein
MLEWKYMSANLPSKQNAYVLPPPAPAVRQRLQSAFEHGQRCFDKGEHDYANDLFTQCVTDDPGNLTYLQHFITNLAQKYGDNKKGARLAGLKIKSGRNALIKATAKGDWHAAFQAACEALRFNPWDRDTLIALSDACQQIGSSDAEVFLLRWALDLDVKDPVVNRRAGMALARLGQFDQAISCWRRVEQAKPGDQEASKAISQLSVEQTIQKGGYNEELLRSGESNVSDLEMAVRSSMARGRKDVTPSMSGMQAESEDEKSLLVRLQANPAEVANYLDLATLFASQHRLREAEQILTQALAVSGGGDMNVRERLEEAQLQRIREQSDIANRRAEHEKTPETAELAKRMATQCNQVEMEVYAGRAAREPGNLMLQFELGLRAKRAGKFREAIQAFQAARDDSRQRATVQLHLGESFQHIRQFKLALSSYEAAVAAADTSQPDVQKLALYRAGVLAAELGETDRAEKYLAQLAAIDFGYRDVADRLDKLAALRDIG